MENALDAGATRVAVGLVEGGRALITVVDDGAGMSAEEMALAVERHCTSKLDDGDDLLDIRTLGFRGEALPSIASVSRFALTSRPKGADSAWTLRIDGGAKSEPVPAAHPSGTRVEVRDLFYAVPARLKFLRSRAAGGAGRRCAPASGDGASRRRFRPRGRRPHGLLLSRRRADAGRGRRRRRCACSAWPP